MDIDFHYYATYAAACLAGHAPNEASIIAHAAQYVDDSSMDYLVDNNGAYYLSDFRPVPTVHTFPQLAMYEVNPLLWGGTYLSNLRQVWSVFHFLPGNYGQTPDQKTYEGPRSTATWQFGKVEEDEFKMLCLPNSGLAGRIVNDIRESHQGQDYLLHLTGLRMHVLADTWAHMYYTGSPAWCINDAGEHVYHIRPDGSEREIVWEHRAYKYFTDDNDINRGEQASMPSAFTNSVVYLGHGRMGHVPDYPWITYRYKPSWFGGSEGFVKNNPECYVKAFKQLVWAMRCIRNNTVFNPLDEAQDTVINAAQEAVLREILAMKGDEDGREVTSRRCQMWVRRLPDLQLEVPPPYDAKQWLAAFQQAGNKPGTDYYRFNRSARLQLDLVAKQLQHDIGVTIDNTVDSVVVPLRLQASTGTFLGAMVESSFGPTTQYYPRLGSEGVTLEFLLAPGQTVLRSGAHVRIRTTEPATGKYSYLGAWSTPALYYYTQDYDAAKQGWIVRKDGGTDGEEIKPGDSIVIGNVAYAGQSMVWYSYGDGYKYLTTKEGRPAEALWTVRLTAAEEQAQDERDGRVPPLLTFGSRLSLQADNGAYVGALDSGAQYYPRVLSQAISLCLENAGGPNDGTRPINNGDALTIRTTEPAAGDYKYLGAWSTTALYYYTQNYDRSKQGWILEKVRGWPGPQLREGDVVRLRNQSYSNKPYITHYQDGNTWWLTTKSGEPGQPDLTVDWVVRKA